MQDQLNAIFKEVDDPRSYRNQKHPFISLIGVSLLGVISGIDSFSGFADYAEAHLEGLKRYFDFPNGAPSHDTFQRLWDTIDPVKFCNSFHEFTKTIQILTEGIISIDGKTIRNSGDNPLHIVSAWCTSNDLVLAQEKVDSKSNEITAIPKLLDLLDLKSKLITIDAMGCQRKICSQIAEQGGDYLISLKGNQGTLHEDIKLWFTDKELIKQCSSWEENDKGHGRIEQRTAYVTDDINWLQERHKWPYLKSIGVVVSKVIKANKETQEMRFYVSSMEASAEKLCKAARAHWGIENKLHWRLDVVFNEDGCCITNDNAAENMDILRKWALNILHKAKTKPSQSIKSVQRKSAMSFTYLISVVNKIFHA